MSIVVVKVLPEKIEIASDSITVRGWTQSRSTNSFSKLVKVNDLIIGSVGTAEEGALLQVFCSTRRPDQATELSIVNFLSEFANWKNTKTGVATITNEYIFIVDKHVFQIHGFFVEEIINFAAIGAGMDFALAALHLGHEAEKAVEVACELSVFCELPTKLYEVDTTH